MNKSHGLCKHPLYSKWCGMKGRCYQKNHTKYKNYGGRGITVCEEWKNDFLAFYNWSLANGWEEGLTIERNDVNGHYEPENCSWIPMSDQSKNQTKSIIVEYRGESGCLRDIVRRYSTLEYRTVFNRLKYLKWDLEEAMSRPIDPVETSKSKYKNIYKAFGEIGSLRSLWDKFSPKGLTLHRVRARVYKEWSVEDALTKPVDLGYRNKNYRGICE